MALRQFSAEKLEELVVELPDTCSICFGPCTSMTRYCCHPVHRGCLQKANIHAVNHGLTITSCPLCRRDVTVVPVYADRLQVVENQLLQVQLENASIQLRAALPRSSGAVYDQLHIAMRENEVLKHRLFVLGADMNAKEDMLSAMRDVRKRLATKLSMNISSCTMVCTDFLSVVSELMREIEFLQYQIQSGSGVSSDVDARSFQMGRDAVMGENEFLRRRVNETEACHHELCMLLEQSRLQQEEAIGEFKNVLHAQKEKARAELKAQIKRSEDLRNDDVRKIFKLQSQVDDSKLRVDSYKQEVSRLHSEMFYLRDNSRVLRDELADVKAKYDRLLQTVSDPLPPLPPPPYPAPRCNSPEHQLPPKYEDYFPNPPPPPSSAQYKQQLRYRLPQPPPPPPPPLPQNNYLPPPPPPPLPGRESVFASPSPQPAKSRWGSETVRRLVKRASAAFRRAPVVGGATGATGAIGLSL